MLVRFPFTRATHVGVTNYFGPPQLIFWVFDVMGAAGSGRLGPRAHPQERCEAESPGWPRAGFPWKHRSITLDIACMGQGCLWKPQVSGGIQPGPPARCPLTPFLGECFFFYYYDRQQKKGYCYSNLSTGGPSQGSLDRIFMLRHPRPCHGKHAWFHHVSPLDLRLVVNTSRTEHSRTTLSGSGCVNQGVARNKKRGKEHLEFHKLLS